MGLTSQARTSSSADLAEAARAGRVPLAERGGPARLGLCRLAWPWGASPAALGGPGGSCLLRRSPQGPGGLGWAAEAGIGSGAAKRTAARKEPGGVSRCRCWARPAETALPRALGPTISSAPGVLLGRKHPSSDPRHQPLLQRGQMLLLTGHLGLRGEYLLLVAMAASSLSDSSV